MVRRFKSSDSSYPDYKLDLWSRPSVFSHAVVEQLKPVYPASHRSTRLSQELALHVLLTNFKDWLSIADGQDHEVAGIRISKRRDYYTKPSRLGSGAWVSYDALVWALDWLEKVDLVRLAQKGFNYDGIGKLSLYKPTAQFTALHISTLLNDAILPELVAWACDQEAPAQPDKCLDRVLYRGSEVPPAQGMRAFLKQLNNKNLAHRWTIEGLNVSFPQPIVT